MVDVTVNFTLENEEPVNAEFQVQPDVTFTADISTETSTRRHEELINRDYPDQHPIEAITNLREILNKMWTFTYEQGVASDTWTITHNLGRKPSVVVVDSADNVFYPAVQYIDLNTVVVTMNGATTGKAYLN